MGCVSLDDPAENPLVAPAVEVLEGGDEDGALGQRGGRAEAERRLERLHRPYLGLIGFALQVGRAVERRAVGGDDGPLLVQRRKRDTPTFKERRANTAFRRVPGGRPDELGEKLRCSQYEGQIFRTDQLAVGHVDGVFRTHGYMVEFISNDANRALPRPDLRNDEITGQSLQKRPLVATLLVIASEKQLAAERHLGDDVELIEWSLLPVDGGNTPREDVAKRNGIEGISLRSEFRSFDPGVERPPPPDQAAEGRRKSGASSGSAPASTHDSKARQASRVPGRSSGTFSPVSPIEVMPTALGAATKTG